MKNQKTRRNFVKTMLATPIVASLPFAASGISPMASIPASVSKKFSHKFKISLNVYSFNVLLQEGIWRNYRSAESQRFFENSC